MPLDHLLVESDKRGAMLRCRWTLDGRSSCYCKHGIMRWGGWVDGN